MFLLQLSRHQLPVLADKVQVLYCPCYPVNAQGLDLRGLLKNISRSIVIFSIRSIAMSSWFDFPLKKIIVLTTRQLSSHCHIVFILMLTQKKLHLGLSHKTAICYVNSGLHQHLMRKLVPSLFIMLSSKFHCLFDVKGITTKCVPRKIG